jgi:thioredoxin reductase (NADPH)
MENIIIIGGGPAGNTAAIYAARANLNPLMLEGFYAGGVAAGGQLTTTTEVENYPGYTAIQGPELMLKMREQAIHCGTRIETKTVDSVDLGAMPYTVVIGGQTLESRAVIISTGATAKRM